MKTSVIILSAVTCLSALGVANAQTEAAASAAIADPTNKTAFASDTEKASYALGAYNGLGWKRNEMEVDIDAYIKGLKDAFVSGKPSMTEAEMRDTLTAMQKKVTEKREAQRKVLATENLKKADQFLAENKSKDGVITTESGLQYKVITEGAGAIPTATDNVKVNYRGTLIDGTEFDNSARRNGPAPLSVKGVIKGWSEALQKMKVGSKWQLFIPPAQAYGEQGRPNIPPNSLLIFDIELVDIMAPTPPPAPAQPLTSPIIKVPSAEEMKKGAKIETLTEEDVQREIKKQQTQTTNPAEKK